MPGIHKKQFVGKEIKGKTLGVIGLGAIGALVANDALDLDMDVIGFDPFLNLYSGLPLVERSLSVKCSNEALLPSSLASLFSAQDSKKFV